MWLANKTPPSASSAIWHVVRTLLTNQQPGDPRIVKTSGTGTGGVYAQLGNVWQDETVTQRPLAWAVIRGRAFYDGPQVSGEDLHAEYLIQTDGAGGLRLLLSPRATFRSGTPSPQESPVASDQVTVLGGGTPASPTFETLLPGAGSRLQGYASEYDDTCWFLTYPVGGGPASSLLFIDAPAPLLTRPGGYLRDPSPYLLYARSGANCALADDIAGEPTAPRAVIGYGTPRQLWARCPALESYSRGTGGLRRVMPGGCSTVAGDRWGVPTYPEGALRYVRGAGLSGTLLAGEVGDPTQTDDRGASGMIRWSGAPARVRPELLDRLDPATGYISTGAAIAIGHVVLPWCGIPLDV